MLQKKEDSTADPIIQIDVHIHVEPEYQSYGRRARPDETGGWAKSMSKYNQEQEEEKKKNRD